MTLSEYLKPASAAVGVVVVAAGYYWIEHRSHPVENETPSSALVVVAKATNACFSDLVRVTGFIVPRREAVVGVEQEGSRVTDLLVHEGDMVTENQELARLTAADGTARKQCEAGADLAARPGRRAGHPGQHHRRRARLAAGRTDVPNFHQQRRSNWMPKYRPSTC